MALSKAYKAVIERWESLPHDYSEINLEINLVELILSALGIGIDRKKKDENIGINQVLRPDYLIYKEPNQPPVLVIEDKRRVAYLAGVDEPEFERVCKSDSLYKEALGYPESSSNNGVKQYLDLTKVKPQFLASYGLVFNGDFFQLWRRVDGLVFPLTPIQKVTPKSIPELLRQLENCLKMSTVGLTASIWNQKGGVSKTTSTINFGATLALEGKKVLLVDLDPQNDLTRGLGLNLSKKYDYLIATINQIELRESEHIIREALKEKIQSKKFGTSDGKSYLISVLSEDKYSLDEIRNQSISENRPQQFSGALFIRNFRRILEILKQEYDYIFIDTSPAPDVLTQAALFASDTILIPVDYGRKALHHAIRLHHETIPRIRDVRLKQSKFNFAPWSLGIMFSNCPNDIQQVDELIKQELKVRQYTGKQYKTRLRTYAQVKLAEFKHAPVISWQKSPITKLCTDLTNEVFLSHNFIDY